LEIQVVVNSFEEDLDVLIRPESELDWRRLHSCLSMLRRLVDRI